MKTLAVFSQPGSLALDEGVGRLLLLEALEDRRLVTQAGDGLARLAVDQENGRPLLAIRTSRVLELPFGSRCVLCAAVSREAFGQWRPQPRRSTDTRPMKAVFSFDFADTGEVVSVQGVRKGG